MFSTRPTIRIALATLASSLLLAPPVAAQEPQDAPPAPEWTTDLATSSMVLSPTPGRLALGLPSARATLQVFGQSVGVDPGTGYMVLGEHSSLHMKLDRNDIQVAGGQPNTVGSLYLQRYGGPMIVHGSMSLEERVYVTQDGQLGLGTADPRSFAVDQGFVGPYWPQPRTAIAVDGDLYSDRSFTNEVRVLERLRVGEKIDLSQGAAFDYNHADAIAMIGGKLSAQEIVVHIVNWADDVFDEDYALMPLDELAVYVEREGHLPGVPSTEEVQRGGLDLAEANALLLRKVEELTLHTIEQDKEIRALEQRLEPLEDLEARIDALEAR